MHQRRDLPQALARLAEVQADVVTREQVLGLGLSRHVIERLLVTDRWRAVARGIYHTLPAELRWHSLAWAGVLIGGGQARMGPRASAYLYQLLDVAPMPIDILVPTNRYTQRSGPWAFHRERTGARRPESRGALPRLSVEDTVLDLCASSGDGEAMALLAAAVQRRLTTPARLVKSMSHRSRQRHRRMIADVLSDVEQGAESRLELSYLRLVERPHELPKGERQKRRQGLQYVSDVGYDEYALLIELDGRLGHQGADRFRDMERDNRFAVVSWTTLRYGWFDVVERPCAVARQVAEVLTMRGWPGPATPCPRCLHWQR
jgi:very-short-patch-repair endonuclease